jgi:uncharacterized membrane protein (DUF4010 family)
MGLRESLVSLLVAVACGIALGAERQQSQLSKERTRDFGGVRTFPMISLLGALGAMAAPVAGMWLLGGAFVGVIAFVAVSHARTSSEGHLGISSEVAALLCFALGAVSAMPALMPDRERHLLVGAVTAGALALLALKRPLHSFIAALAPEDVYATVKFVVLVLVVLPALPDQAYGPFAAFNPYKIGKMIVLVAAVSFAGYIAARVVGQHRGLLAAALLGGLVSSTAVTMTYAGRAKEEPSLVSLCAVAITAACSVMFARVVVVVAVIDRALIPSLGPALGVMAVAGFAGSLALYAKARKGEKPDAGAGEAEVKLKNPFELRQAVSFGLVYALVLLIARAAQAWLGTGGLYVSAVAAGLTDVDAITLSVTEMHRGGLAQTVATVAITLAAVTNTLVKTGLATSLGGAALGKRVGAVLGGAMALGGATAGGVALWA